MADVVFILRSWTGRRILQLRADALTVSGEYFGRKTVQEIPIRSISPEYQRQARRFSLLIVVPLILGAVCMMLIVLFLTADNTLVNDLAMYPALFLVVFVIGAFRGVPRTDFFIFFDHRQRSLLSVVRDPGQAEEFDAFVHELLDRIEQTENGLSRAAERAAPILASSVALPSPDDWGSSALNQSRWLASLFAGAISAAFPWLPKLLPIFGPLVFPVVFLGSVGGLCWGIGSLMAKEPNRRWSIAGMVLSLIAPLFY